MKYFSEGQKIKVIDNFDTGRSQIKIEALKSLIGKTGVVNRCLIRDCSAWVKMDEDITDDNLRSFPANDEYGRGNELILWPDECEIVDMV